jgi:hypothetical protein
MYDMPDLPDFLRIPQAARNAAWRGRKVRSMQAAKLKMPKKEIPADVLAFMKEEEKRRKAAMAERFAMLRERAAEKKRLGR